jgi:nitric oxide reductase subunit B
MSPIRRLWIALAVVLVVSFATLGILGRDIYRAVPPIPTAVQTDGGDVVFTAADIETGRQVWQSLGGHQLGSIWGHGSYVAPDWSADWLHREGLALQDTWAQWQYATPWADLDASRRAILEARLPQELRANTHDPRTGIVIVSRARAHAIRQVAAHYRSLFSDDPASATLREQYAIREDPLPDPARREALTAFFFWTAWAAVTERPGSQISYTSNWPADASVGNVPTPGIYMWTFVSIFGLLAGIGALAWYHAVTGYEEHPAPPATDPLAALAPTASMRAVRKYFWTVIALFGLQVVLGAVTAHYAVEGQAFYGFPLADYVPYTVARTWHTQLAVFWIATAWLATGLYIAPAVSGHEPKYQVWGVNFLYVCLVVIVVGSMVGQWFGVMQKLGLTENFWFGHQGYEYVDLGRFWQIFLFIGLLLWLFLVGRALWPALAHRNESRSLTWLLFLSTIAIGLMYGAGLMWGQHTHLAVMEYWRWWVVHLWVEGFFEVFATAVIAFLFTRLGLVRVHTATVAVLFATIVFLAGGVLGLFHHLYFTGTPTAVLAFGAMFSALEVVPLVLIGFDAYGNYKRSASTAWVATYRWPILFFVAVGFWNLVGAGLFGFLINPPLALYYMQGLNTTPLHGHTALFGVYGMLGIGLMLFCLRGLAARAGWDDRLLRGAFWSLNIGLAMMAVMSLAPYGLMQVHAAVTHGYWYARSAEFLQSPVMQSLVWLRVPGDIVFSVGVLLIAVFAVKLWLGGRGRREVAPAGAVGSER